MTTAEDDVNKAQRAVQSMEVGGRILLALASSHSSMLLRDLAAAAGLPSSRAHPYLVSLSRLGFVRQDAVSGRYALGPSALQLGLTALHQLEPVQAVRPFAETLAADTNQAVAVAVWGNLGPTIIQMIDAVQPLHVAMRVGTVMSPFGSATGRAFAGVIRGEKIGDALSSTAMGSEHASERFKVADYEHEIHGARAELAEHGCTRAVGNPIPGVNAFSAPVFDHECQPALVITLMGRDDNLSSSWESPMAVALKETAAEVSKQLGYRM